MRITPRVCTSVLSLSFISLHSLQHARDFELAKVVVEKEEIELIVSSDKSVIFISL